MVRGEVEGQFGRGGGVIFVSLCVFVIFVRKKAFVHVFQCCTELTYGHFALQCQCTMFDLQSPALVFHEMSVSLFLLNFKYVFSCFYSYKVYHN